MAEEEERFEVRAMNDLYGRVQSAAIDKSAGAIQRLTGMNKNEEFTPENSVADKLGKQADSLTAADDTLGQIDRSNRYSSRGQRAAQVERGIKDKMRAIGMLDKTIDVGESVTDKAVAEYVDPLTGQTVRADGELGDHIVDRAKWEAVNDSLQENLSGYENLSSMIEYRRGEEMGWVPSWDAKAGKMVHKRERMMELKAQDGFWEKAYGTAGVDMQQSYKDGQIDLAGLKNGLQTVERNANRLTLNSTSQAVDEEFTLRQDNALKTADTFNTQESLATAKADELSSEAQRSKTALRTSIKKDKQNLARQNDGGVSDEKKTRIDYGSDNSRPV